MTKEKENRRNKKKKSRNKECDARRLERKGCNTATHIISRFQPSSVLLLLLLYYYYYYYYYYCCCYYHHYYYVKLKVRTQSAPCRSAN